MAEPEPAPEASLDEFLCFAIYSANLAIGRAYRPLLEALDVTYLQYVVLVALWERDGQLVGELCDRLFLTTSTITPVLKKLERSGLLARRRRPGDDRQVGVSLTDKGHALRAKAATVPDCINEATAMPAAQRTGLIEAVTRLRDTMLQKQGL